MSKKREIESKVDGSGRMQHRIWAGSIELVATSRNKEGLGRAIFDVEQITPGPFASGLSEDEAKDLLIALAALKAKYVKYI